MSFHVETAYETHFSPGTALAGRSWTDWKIGAVGAIVCDCDSWESAIAEAKHQAAAMGIPVAATERDRLDGSAHLIRSESYSLAQGDDWYHQYQSLSVEDRRERIAIRLHGVSGEIIGSHDECAKWMNERNLIKEMSATT